ncbi:HK97 gp10 family phage protein [Acinetobacter brisouii]|uniref:HK97 gp10 family phage protein n=1 Tax=Acinetobacter brisouii TaxID=396323 RepID=UPI00124DE010|nr:HK97 gp10 family phage protein [Acinetobacter brisouii]
MGLKSQNMSQMFTRLSRLKEVPNIADHEMAQIAQEIKHTAHDMAPTEYNNIRKAIKVRREGGTEQGTKGFLKGVSNYSVYVDGSMPAHGHAEQTVGEYVWMVHEHMGWEGHPGAIMPSKQSLQAGNGIDPVGGKFIDRATQKHKINSAVRIQKVVRDYVHRLD